MNLATDPLGLLHGTATAPPAWDDAFDALFDRYRGALVTAAG